MTQPTVSEHARWSWFQEIGCIPCIIEGHPGTPSDIAHETRGGRRTGHEYTFPMCPWHHRGVRPEGMDKDQATFALGPSFALSKKAFVARYGTERMLSERTDKLIARLM